MPDDSETVRIRVNASAINFDVNRKLYLELFKARDDCFAIQRTDGSYAPSDNEFTESILDDHIDGELTTGQYAVHPGDNTVKFAAIDNDIETDSDAPLDNALEAAWAQVDRAVELGLRENQCWVEFSGRRGYHAWFFFDPPITAAKAKRLTEHILGKHEDQKEEEDRHPDYDEDEGAIITIDGGHTEVFPKQVRLSEKGYGNLIKTPLGVHQKTGDRMVFVDRDGEPYQDQAPILRAAGRNRIRPSTVDGILEDFDDDIEEIEAESSTKSFGGLEEIVDEDFDIRPCVQAALTGEQGQLNGETGHHMRLAAAAELLNNGYSIEEAHQFFKRFDNYDRETTQKKLEDVERNLPRPWSCSKLKDKCGEYTRGCPCPYQNIDAVSSMKLNREQYGDKWEK